MDAGPARGLHSGFLDAVGTRPDSPALEVADQRLTFAELHGRAAAVAATLAQAQTQPEVPLTAVFAYRTVTAFSGLLGALLRGHGYVPLNRTLPAERTRFMLEHSGAEAVVADRESAEQLKEILDGFPRRLVVLLPDEDDVRDLARLMPDHALLGGGDLVPVEGWQPEPIDPEDLAYLLFTSGSTGRPKGVAIRHRNVTGLMEAMADRFGITERDRISQTHELTFDVSVFDMFVAWARAACVCCPSQKTLIAPARWIRQAELTVWFSVPSTAILMRQLGMLKPGSYPSLRWSLFAGEPLPVQVAEEWLDAAPNAGVENLYGPTEATIVCLGYRWEPGRSEQEAEAGVIPVGEALPGMAALVVDPRLDEVAPGEVGELLICGPQVASGYWRDPERTAAAFVRPPGKGEVYYRTGDRVRRSHDGRPMTYLGRLDSQIKVRGVRIELGEVEQAIRDATGVDGVVAMGWPETLTGADGIVAFVGGLDVDTEATRQRLQKWLPPQMVPRDIQLLEQLPLNPHGKFDRQALRSTLEKDA